MFAYHIDLKRAMWRLPYLLDYGRCAHALGYTHILLEIEDKFRYRNHPALAHPDAFDHAAYHQLIDGWRNIGLDVVPLCQTLGHAESVVGKPEYAHLREQSEVTDQYDPTSEAVRNFLIELLDELIEILQPGEFFHIGGDETWSLGKSERLRLLVETIGIGGLYARHMRPLLEHIRDRGLRPLIWADMILTHPEILPKIPKWVVMMDWDYLTGSQRAPSIRPWGMDSIDRDDVRKLPAGPVRDLIERYAMDAQTERDGTFRCFFYADALRDMGFEVITASANRCWGDAIGTPRNEGHLPNVFYSARKGRALLGNTVTSWAVRHSHPSTHWLANSVAATAWKTDAPYDANQLTADFCTARYGVECPEYVTAVQAACRTWYEAQACCMARRRKALADGDDPFDPDWLQLADGKDNRNAARVRLQSLRDGYAEAQAIIADLAKAAQRHAEELEFWLEGIAYNLLHADCLLAALDGITKNTAADLQRRLAEQRETTRSLFERTYEPDGVKQELDLRYGFLELWLAQQESHHAF